MKIPEFKALDTVLKKQIFGSEQAPLASPIPPPLVISLQIMCFV